MPNNHVQAPGPHSAERHCAVYSTRGSLIVGHMTTCRRATVPLLWLNSSVSIDLDHILHCDSKLQVQPLMAYCGMSRLKIKTQNSNLICYSVRKRLLRMFKSKRTLGLMLKKYLILFPREGKKKKKKKNICLKTLELKRETMVFEEFNAPYTRPGFQMGKLR